MTDCVCCLKSVCVLPISRGDSFLLLTLCGEAPCCSSILTFPARPASAARVRHVSPSSVCSSRVRSVDANTATKTPTRVCSSWRNMLFVQVFYVFEKDFLLACCSHPAAPRAGCLAVAAQLLRAEAAGPCCRAL